MLEGFKAVSHQLANTLAIICASIGLVLTGWAARGKWDKKDE